jgi:DNA repair photolyase
MIRPALPAKRGAQTNPACRYDGERREAVDDGWEVGADDPPPPLATEIAEDASRTILTRNRSPDLPFDRSINPYRGCEHGCIYCFARPSHAMLGLSPGLDFESRLFVKPRAAELLAAELRRPSYRPAPIAIGTNTDPYQPIEGRYRIMRACLEVLADFNHPVTITTKGHGITRDIDLLAPMAAKGLAAVGISVTTLDRSLCRVLEPRAAVPERRLDAIGRLSAAGIPTTVLVAPVIPALTDHELERILEAGRQAGADSAAWILLRLPGEVAGLFEEWLATHRPDRAGRILSLIRQARDGHLYRAEFGRRMTGDGPVAEMLERRFRLAVRRLGLAERRPAPLRTDLFRPPPRAGDQLSLW